MLPASYAVPAAVLFIVGGALACFFGYRLFRIVLGLYGFVLGALVATAVMAPVETSTTLVVALVGGAVGALVLMGAYFIGVAFAGAALAALLVHVVYSRFGAEPHALVVVGGCIAGALISLALQRFVIIFGTAFGGAWTLLVGAITVAAQRGLIGAPLKADQWLAYPLNPAPGERWVPFAWVALGLLGALAQLWKGGRRRLRAKAKRVKKAA